MPRIDLHSHSTLSDGTFTPQEVVALARERGLDVLALTDHDTTAGLDEAQTAADEAGIELVPGVEFSATLDGKSVHLLAYWPDTADESFAGELRRLHDDRFTRGERMVEKLRELGYPIEFARVREIARGDNIVRPHVAQALVEAGIVATEEEAFTRLIGDEGPADIPKHALAPIDALALIRRAGGVCVLAHPGMWGADGAVPDGLIEELTAAGMSGLEVDHPDHTPEDRTKYRAMAESLGLVATGASDCHGTRYDPVRLGSETTSPEAFERLKAARTR